MVGGKEGRSRGWRRGAAQVTEPQTKTLASSFATLKNVLQLFFPIVLLFRLPETIQKIFEPDFTRIRCPVCGWQPAKTDRWLCNPGCNHTWNTFETHGVCPSCSKHWAETACLACSVWSLHASWYERSQE